MKKQTGFTLIELAIVLVIIGLLLGGVLKGQELINSAKVKNLASDFRNIQVFLYGYQDKFKALPGDDAAAATHISGATTASTPANKLGNGVIDGMWDSQTTTDESIMFWQHVRLAGLAPGETVVNLTTYIPHNAVGGIIGITNGTAANNPVATLKGSFVVCSQGILGKFAKQLDTNLDDGNTATGSVQAIADVTTHPQPTIPQTAIATAMIDDATPYTVCMSF